MGSTRISLAISKIPCQLGLAKPEHARGSRLEKGNLRPGYESEHAESTRLELALADATVRIGLADLEIEEGGS